MSEMDIKEIGARVRDELLVGNLNRGALLVEAERRVYYNHSHGCGGDGWGWWDAEGCESYEPDELYTTNEGKDVEITDDVAEEYELERISYTVTWVTVAVCFSELGAERYLQRNRHHFPVTRVRWLCADPCSHPDRNYEMLAVLEHLAEVAA